ncbi:hypothetical protein PanWU01x14_305520 [Parasponia andersonii]|uniref:Uncharacterized protein n=1 Tax=Parasponia andersonii TaxID=3476 RepID=A0A2P5AS54_PARAD|nr:hypothetical protein PanWU01x14_305520 [Parasponia andersonii]
MSLAHYQGFANTQILQSKRIIRFARVCQSYALADNCVRRDLVTTLTSENDLDVYFMIDLANAALAALSSLQADFADLYETTSAATKLKDVGHALTKAKTNGAMLVTQILETRELLKELEAKLEKGDREVDSLQAEYDKLQKIYGLRRARPEKVKKGICRKGQN